MRGEGSLQALLGRDVTKQRKRKPSGPPTAAADWRVMPSPSPAPTSTAAAAASSSIHDGPTATAAAAAAAARSHAAIPSTQAGPSNTPVEQECVRCPLCNIQLPHDHDKVNAHIDKCLSKGLLKTRTQQATIVQFASRSATARQQPHKKQQRQEQQPGAGSPPSTKRPRSTALASGAAAAAGSILGTARWVDVDLTGASDEDQGQAVETAGIPCSRPLPATTTAEGSGSKRQQQQQQQQAAGKHRAEQSPSVSWPSQGTPSSQEAPPVHSPRREHQQTARSSLQASSAAGGGKQALLSRAAATAAARPASLRCFPCSVVGRQYQKHDVRWQSGQRLVVEWEAGNPRDTNALLALDAHSRLPLGHLPRAVARHLAPLLKSQQVVVEAVVQEEPLGDKAPLLAELQISLQQPGGPGPSPGAAARVAAALGRAAAAAATQLQQQPQAMGERLHHNFLTVLDTVQHHDGHLLAQEETGFIAAYKALELPAQCLFLRLFQRKGPLFALASLAYSEVPDAAAAAGQLAAAGLAATWTAASGIRGGTSRLGASSSSDSGGGSSSAAAASGGTASWADLAELLTVPDLAAVLAARKIKAAPAGGDCYSAAQGGVPRNRQQMLAALEGHAKRSAAVAAQLTGWLLAATGPVVRLSDAACEAVGRLQRLFFLNEGQSLTQFLASDLGHMQYPRYQVHRSCPAFARRADLLAYEAALRHTAELMDANEAEDVEGAEAALQPAWAALDANLHKQPRDGPGFLRRFHAGEVYCIMANMGVDLLERQKRYKEAVQRLDMLLGGCCCPTRRGEWWERLSINLKHLGRHQEALERAEAALADEALSCGDRLTMQRRVLLLGKPPWRWKTPAWKKEAQREPPVVRIQGRPLNRTTGAKSRFYGLDEEQCGVEELALQHYATEEGGGWQGVHCEGGVWAMLFGLLLWDVLFMPVPDVFRTPFQTAPLDLDTPLFYPTRKEAVKACLARVAAGEAPRMLAAAWEQHEGTMCRGVRWDRHELEELQVVAECVGGRQLAAVCRLLAIDHGGWSGGMPDLLLWRPARRDAKLAEVKGPRDRLSNQQRAWINALRDAGFHAEVLKVEEPSSHGSKKQRR